MQNVPAPHPQNKNLLRILSTIYSLPIASDFRRPVELMYPKIAAAYLSVISTPMDLGTLLLACMRDTATPELIRDGLNLVFTNSMNFNGAAPMMKALSLHLLTYAEGLFEEAVKLPFDISQGGVITETEFLPTLLRKRGLRFETMCKTPLRQDEVKLLEQCLRSVDVEEQPFWETTLNIVYSKIKAYQVCCANAEEHVSEDTAVPILTLESVLRPVVEAAVWKRDKYGSSSSSSSSMDVDGDDTAIGSESTNDQMFPAIASLVGLRMHRESKQYIAPIVPSKKDNKKSTPKSKKDKAATALGDSEAAAMDVQEEVSHDNEVDKESGSSAAASTDATNSSTDNVKPPVTFYKPFIPMLFAIDASLGELLVQLEERVLRGTTSSSVWQKPMMLGWAAAGGIWFPCMVLACPAANSPSECKLAPGAFHGKEQAQAIVDINASRIPDVIIKQLTRLKTKSCGMTKTKNQGGNKASSSSSSSSSAISSRGVLSYEEQNHLLVVPEGFLLIEFFGTHDFGWVKAEAVLPFCVDGTKPSHNRVGSGVDGVRMACSTERWWLLETFQYLPPPHRARLIERIQIDRHATLVSVANSQGTRTKPTSASSPSSSSSSLGGKMKGSSGNAKNQTSHDSMMATDEDSMKSDEMNGEAREDSDLPPFLKKDGTGLSEQFHQNKGQGSMMSFTWIENDEDAIKPCVLPSIDDLEESTIITNRPYFVPVAANANTFSQKQRKEGASAFAAGSGHTTTRVFSGKSGHLSAATIARAAAIATALDYSDYSCLVFGGLYSSSLVPIDKRQSKRDIAKDKSLIFSRWAESVSPTPACDSSRRGTPPTPPHTTSQQ